MSDKSIKIDALFLHGVLYSSVLSEASGINNNDGVDVSNSNYFLRNTFIL